MSFAHISRYSSIGVSAWFTIGHEYLTFVHFTRQFSLVFVSNTGDFSEMNTNFYDSFIWVPLQMHFSGFKFLPIWS